MAPLDPKSTPRLYINYTSGGTAHTAVLRLATTADEENAALVYDVIAQVMVLMMDDNDTVQGADFSSAGTNVRNPLSVSPYTGQVTGTPDLDRRPTFYSWVGRSTDGRRTRFTLFTLAAQPDQDGYRYPTPAGPAAAMLDALEELSPPVVTISNLPPVWKSYVNAGYNAYWQRQLRKL